MNEKTKTNLHLNAVVALLNEPVIRRLLDRGVTSADWAREIVDENYIESPPDWLLAGRNCKNDEDIVAVCVHTFLMDWEPEEAK